MLYSDIHWYTGNDQERVKEYRLCEDIIHAQGNQDYDINYTCKKDHGEALLELRKLTPQLPITCKKVSEVNWSRKAAVWRCQEQQSLHASLET